nr:MADS-box transcription factor [Spirodela polyrhiza]
MVRIKMPLRLIEGEKHRNTTFMKRRAVIKKKAMELGKLCDIVTLLVCFGPRGQLETWPEDRQEVRRIIEHYASLNPDDCIKRRYDLTTFFEAHLKRLQAEINRERNAWLDALPAADSLEDLLRSLDAKLAAIGEKICRVELEDKDESRGNEMEACWGQHLQALEAAPSADIVPLNAIFVDPQGSLHGVIEDLHKLKPERFGGRDLWGTPHGHHQRDSEMTTPGGLAAHSSPDPYAPPLLLPDNHGFATDMRLLDELLSADFPTYPAAGTSAAATAEDVFDPTVSFPLSFCRDASLGSGMEHLNALPFEHSGYNVPLHHLPRRRRRHHDLQRDDIPPQRALRR